MATSYFKYNQYPSKQKLDEIREVFPRTRYYSPAKYSERSRYQNIRVLRAKHEYHPNKYVKQCGQYSNTEPYHETSYRRFIFPSDYLTVTVTGNYINRMDVIANQQYGDSRLWWVIAEANPQFAYDPLSLPEGAIIKVPNITEIYKVGGPLNA